MKALKRLEYAWKDFLFGVIRLYLRIRPSNPVSDWTTGPRRVLFLRQDRIGDAIVSTGLLRAIAGISPDLQLDVLASPRNVKVIRRFPFVREVHLFDKRNPRTFLRLWRQLRRGRYDAVIDCMVTARSMTGLLLMLSSGSAHRMGVAGRGVDWGLTVAVPPGEGHIIEMMTVFAEAFGVDPGSVDWRPVLELTPEEREWAERQWASASGERSRRFLANVSAGEPRRAWPDDRYIQVIRAVRAAHPDLVVRVVGAPSEWERVEAIAAAVDAPAIATPDIAMVIALVGTADYVFTPDTSLVHMASAFQKPTVAMFIRDTSAQWGLFETPGANLESEGMTLDSLPAERVIEALDSLMSVESAAT